MADLPIALDLTDAVIWRADGRSVGVLSRSIPCALLPLHEGETPLVGPAAESHRRGAGLVWPPEAQVPVLGDPARGTGRVPLAALWAQLVQGEAGALLENTWVDWQPAGNARRGAEVASVLTCALREWDSSVSVIVTPDGLGLAGQQAILDGINREVHLIPASVAAALAWCRGRSLPAALLRKATPGEGTAAGHLWAVHAGWGRWSAALIHVRAVLADGKPYLTPVFSRQRVIADMGLSGAAMLASSQDVFKAVAQAWDPQWPMGQGQTAGIGPVPLAAWQPLLGDSSFGNPMARLKAAVQRFPADGPCLGVLVHGAWAESTKQDIGRVLGCSVLPIAEGAAVSGAALAEKNWRAELPAWKEELEPFDFNYLGEDEFGNPCVAWKPLVAVATVDAWTEYCPPALEGLAIPAGEDQLALVLRTEEGGGHEFRGIQAKMDRPLERSSPVSLTVHMHPGQGFARVDVRSREPGLFESRLDWRHLAKVDPPSPPKMGYIPRSVVIQADARLWKAAAPALADFLAASPQEMNRRRIIQSVTSKLNRWPKASDYEWGMGRRLHGDNLYLFYSAIGSDGKLPVGIGKEAHAMWQEVRARALELLDPTSPLEPPSRLALHRMLAWSYANCPVPLVRQAEQALRNGSAKALDLHTAGLCFRTSQTITGFWRDVARFLPHAIAPNSWLGACRNLARLNEHALSPEHVDDGVLGIVVSAIARRFFSGVESRKPMIAGNAMEALMHLLKRRRYRKDFLGPGDPLRVEMETMLAGPLPLLSRRHQTMREPFLNLLRCAAGEDDFAALVVSDEGDDEE